MSCRAEGPCRTLPGPRVGNGVALKGWKGHLLTVVQGTQLLSFSGSSHWRVVAHRGFWLHFLIFIFMFVLFKNLLVV